jgi:16S rRNA processing protein RimM
VRALYDFGAGDVVEIAAPDGRLTVLPFTKAVVPTVDVAGGRLVVDPPAATGDPEGGEDAGGPADGTDT